MEELLASTSTSLASCASPESLQVLAAALPHGPAPDALQLAAQLRAEAGKVGLMCAGGDLPPPEELASLLQALHQACQHLCLSLHCHKREAGPTFKSQLEAMIADTAQRCAALVDALQQPAAVATAVGMVWDVCDSVAKAPLTNKAALFKGMGAALRAINDAMREMAEIQQQPEASGREEAGQEGPEAGTEALANGNGHGQPESRGGVASCNGGADSDDESMCDFEAGPLTAEDREAAAAGHALMAVTADTVKLLLRQMVRGPEDLTGQPLEAWENCLWHTKNLQRSVEDLGAAMYPPQELETVEAVAEALVISVQCLLEEIPQEHAEAVAAAAAGLHVQLEAAEQRMQAALQGSRGADQ